MLSGIFFVTPLFAAIVTLSPITKWPAIPVWPPILMLLPIWVLPATPTWAAITAKSPIQTLWAICTKLSILEYSPIIDGLDQYSGLIKYQKKRSIFSKIENDLISEYGYTIKKLRRSQGRILIKLVDRETDRTSFQVIKEFRNIFSAGFWQLTARVFGHNLLSEYNPNDGEDRIIENIINKIENEKRKT